MKDARINLVRVVLEQFGETFRNRKRELNKAEKALYEAALKMGVKELLPRGESAAVLAEYERELNDERARAEEARKKREEKKKEPEIQEAAK